MQTYLPAPDRAKLLPAILAAVDRALDARDAWLRRLAEDAIDSRERRHLRRDLAEAERVVLEAARS